MSETDGPIAVVGATGQQGGAVIDALLPSGRAVRALVRDASSEKARALADRGVELVLYDQDDAAAATDALRGVDALFLMTTFTGDGGTEQEVERGRLMADAAEAAGVPRVIYSSVGGAERSSGIPHFESKYRVEQHLDAMPYAVSVIRPVFFMENLLFLVPELTGDGSSDGELVVRVPLPDDVPLQLVAVADIGRVAARVLLDPQALRDPAIEIAGDELTGSQMADRIGSHLKRPARYEAIGLDGLDDDQSAMFTWFAETPAYLADVELTRQIDPELLGLRGWLDQL